jgi:hypothetical protein
MTFARWGFPLLTVCASGLAQAQLPGLPFSPWQTGTGFFVGSYGTSPPTLSNSSSPYCVVLPHVMPYNSAASAATALANSPYNFTYSPYGAQCWSASSGLFALSSYTLTTSPYAVGLGYVSTYQATSQGPAYNSAAVQILQGPPRPARPYTPPASPQTPPSPPVPQEPPPQPPPDPPPPPLDPPVTPPPLDPHLTPEPATVILLGTGLLVVVCFALLRGSRI